jgi:tripartite-type tricarboxylate transporter receptor subunit TctC
MHSRFIALRRALGLAVAAAAMLAGGAARADSYPDKPIKIVVGFPPGGPTDAVVRIIDEKVSQILGQPLIVENRPGASGNIAAAYVAKSAPDGYTLFFSTAGVLSMNPFLYAHPGFDVVKDFAPITHAVSVPALLVVQPSFPVNDVRGLVARAKAAPGSITFASAGYGGPPHMAMELLKHVASIDLLHVPYKGAGPAVTDLIGGQVQTAILDFPVLLPQVKAGKLKALAITGETRSPLLPDVPTISEAGYAGATFNNWYGLVAPARTPAPVLDRITQAFVAALNDKDVHDKLTQMGAVVVASTPAQFATLIQAEMRRWSEVIKDAGIQPE